MAHWPFSAGRTLCTSHHCSAKELNRKFLDLMRPEQLSSFLRFEGNLLRRSTFSGLGGDLPSDKLRLSNSEEVMSANLAIKLNVLVVCIAFAFVGAILIGAF
jgi:hypothetical protein